MPQEVAESLGEGVAETVFHRSVLASWVAGVRISWHASDMRARLHFSLFSGLLAACGGDDQSTATSMASMSGTMAASTNPGGDTVTGSGESSDSSESTPTGGDLTSAPMEGAPVFLSLQTNVSKITAGESVIFTAVLTDPDGVDDIVGGTLSDETGQIGYGPFVAAGQEGTYSISVSWDDVNQAKAIDFEGMDLMRVFRAEFYDQAANKVHRDLELTLTCAEGSACAGVCADIMTDTEHCGACGKGCDGGCNQGVCAPKWGECIDNELGFGSCNMYCASIGEACAENSCGSLAGTIRGFDQKSECMNVVSPTTIKEACSMVQPWGPGRMVIQCCCTDAK